MKRRAWRLVKQKHAATAFDGDGARLFGGRWNAPGSRVIYTSTTLSLAALEILVHLLPPVAFKKLGIGQPRPFAFDPRLV